MDAISSVAFELVSAAKPIQDPAALPTAYNIQDVARFDAMYAGQAPAAQAATATAPASAVSATEQNGFSSVIAALQNLNGRAEVLGSKTLQPGAPDTLQPGDMLMMAMKAHEFLFHCELTSNVANRTSDGVQQLFREQS